MDWDCVWQQQHARLDRVCPATQRSGEQKEAQKERQVHLAQREARVEPPGWVHVWAVVARKQVRMSASHTNSPSMLQGIHNSKRPK